MATLKELLSTIISKVNSKVTSINGIAPDDNGNVEIQPGVQSDLNEIDETSPAFVKNKEYFATTDYVNTEIDSVRTGITRVESLDAENLVQLRDLETGLYVLYGYFSPYTGSHISMSFDNTMVVVSKKTPGSHLLVFTGTNSKVNFLEIMVDSEAPAGYTYTRTDFVMMDMHNLIAKVGELADLNTTDKSSIVSAINEIVSNFVASEQFNQFKEELVTGKDAATENTKFAIGTAEQSLEIPSMYEFNQVKDDLSNVIEKSPNKVDLTKVINGRINKDGSIFNSVNFRASDYINATENDIIRVVSVSSDGYGEQCSVGFYDSAKNFISKTAFSKWWDGGKVEVTAPKNTSFCKVSIYAKSGWETTWMVTINSEIPQLFSPYGSATPIDVFNATEAYNNSIENADKLDIKKNTSFFVPDMLYGIKNRLSFARKIPLENMFVSHSVNDMYLTGNTYSLYTNHDDEHLVLSFDNSGSTYGRIKRRSNDELLYSIDILNFYNIGRSDVNNPTSIKNVLLIGDSFMDGGYLPCEINNILVNDLGLTNLNFIGHKTDTDGDVTCANCGIGGITLKDYIKTDNAEGRGTQWSNPFLYNGNISFTQYMSNYGNGGSLDIVVIECGVNDMLTFDNFESTNAVTRMRTMINNIHSEYPDCKIYVVGQKYANDVQTTIEPYGWNLQVMNLNKGYYELCKESAYSSFCTYVDIALLYDSLHYSPYQMKPIYKGSEETTRVITDWLHPNVAGYYSIAENIAGAIAYKQFRSN